jgi:hypothetical protein
MCDTVDPLIAGMFAPVDFIAGACRSQFATQHCFNAKICIRQSNCSNGDRWKKKTIRHSRQSKGFMCPISTKNTCKSSNGGREIGKVKTTTVGCDWLMRSGKQYKFTLDA